MDDGTLDGFPALAGVPATDIIGVPRADQLPDIGAYEIPFDEIVVAPIPINFGTVATVSVSSQTVTILNGTANQVTVTSVTLTGSEASHFALDLGSAVFPLVLDSAESFTVELVFNSTIQLPGFNRAVQINVLSRHCNGNGSGACGKWKYHASKHVELDGIRKAGNKAEQRKNCSALCRHFKLKRFYSTK